MGECDRECASDAFKIYRAPRAERLRDFDALLGQFRHEELKSQASLARELAYGRRKRPRAEPLAVDERSLSPVLVHLSGDDARVSTGSSSPPASAPATAPEDDEETQLQNMSAVV